jgi:hypothetical protein
MISQFFLATTFLQKKSFTKKEILLKKKFYFFYKQLRSCIYIDIQNIFSMEIKKKI